MQYRNPPVDSSGPSSKTCPRWQPHVEHSTAVLVIPNLVSTLSTTARAETVDENDGQPVPASYFAELENSFDLHPAHT